MSSSWRRATLKDWWPERSTGVWRIPRAESLSVCCFRSTVGAHTLETQLVALQRGNRLPEELLGLLVARVHSANIDLLPLNGDIVGLEDLLDRLGNLETNTVTGDQSDGVLAAELGRLEDVGLDGSKGARGRRGTPQEGLQKGFDLATMVLSWARGRDARRLTWADRVELRASILRCSTAVGKRCWRKSGTD